MASYISSGGLVNSKKNIILLGNGETHACTVAESGSVFVLNHATGAAITLPTSAANTVGVHYMFINNATTTTSWTITASGNHLYGALLSGAGDAAGNAAGEDVITITTVVVN